MPETGFSTFEAAVEYAGYGWRVLPLHHADKRPHQKKWQHAATADEPTLEGLWEKWPDSNVGVALGPESGIIDIECDDPEAEQELLELFSGEFPVTPTFKSTRGVHRLFKFTPELPWPTNATKKLGKIDFKLGCGGLGSYSVFPPSLHPSGEYYQWLVPPSECEPAELPESVIAKLAALEPLEPQSAKGEKPDAKPAGHWEKLSAGVGAGERNESAASIVGKMIHGMRDPYDNSQVALQWSLIQSWNARNRPPLDEKELKTTFDSILKRHREQHTEQQYRDGTSKYVDRDPATGEAASSPWRLVKVLSEPVRWKLYSPLWETKAPGGCIILTTKDLRSPAFIAGQALEQAGVWLDKWFAVLWNGTKKEPAGLAAQLVENCEVEETCAEDKRQFVVAEVLWDQVARAQVSEGPDQRGRMVRVDSPQGERVWFKFQHALAGMQHLAEPVKSRELVALLKRLGAADIAARTDQAVARYKVLDHEACKVLHRMVLHGSEASGEPVLRDAPL